MVWRCLRWYHCEEKDWRDWVECACMYRVWLWVGVKWIGKVRRAWRRVWCSWRSWWMAIPFMSFYNVCVAQTDEWKAYQIQKMIQHAITTATITLHVSPNFHANFSRLRRSAILFRRSFASGKRLETFRMRPFPASSRLPCWSKLLWDSVACLLLISDGKGYSMKWSAIWREARADARSFSSCCISESSFVIL